MPRFIPTDLVAVKLRGLPYRVNLDSINAFFMNYEAIPNSFVFGYTKCGRKDGFGCLLFEDETVVRRVIREQNREYIGDRYVELYPLTYGEYLNFPYGAMFQPVDHCSLQEHVNFTNINRCLYLMNTPFKAKSADFVTFFSGLESVHPPSQSAIYIEADKSGKKTGRAVVQFASEEEARLAKKARNGQEFLGWAVTIFDYKQREMRKACGIKETEEVVGGGGGSKEAEKGRE